MSIAPNGLTTNGRVDPLGVDRPEFGWHVPGDLGQIAWQIEVSGTTSASKHIHWNSAWIDSPRPFGAMYEGPELVARSSYEWRLRVRLEDRTETPWSASATFDTGIEPGAAWPAKWITTARGPGRDRRTLYFRDATMISSPVVRARAYVTALGWYRLRVNGRDLTGHSLVPRWTPFDQYVEYQTYDVTAELRTGENVIGIVVADGRFRGALGMSASGATYGDDLGVLALVEVEHADGSITRWATDPTWTVGTGRVRTSDPKHGERADLRIDDELWAKPGGTANDSTQAILLPPHSRAIVPEEVERVTAITEFSGIVSRTKQGSQLIDFGQNFAGVARLRLPAGDGQVVRILYSEVLTPEGELDTSYLSPVARGSAHWFQTDEVILGPHPAEYTPSFTIHGFRYVAVEGLETTLGDEDATGIALSSALPQIGEFTASDARLERLWLNALWGLRSNFTDTPTDCPTRERSGWTGDIQVFSAAAAQLVDSRNFLRRYLRNVEAEQDSDGRVPPIIPTEDSRGRKRNPIRFSSSSVGWGDATVMIPWTLYRYYGDVEALRRQYPSAQRWVDQLARRAATRTSLRRRLTGTAGDFERFIVDTGYHWGEWLRPGEGFGEVLGNLLTHRPVVASAYFAHSSGLLAKIADFLGLTEDRDRYRRLSDLAREAWRLVFVRDDGARIGDDKQDDYVRALAFDLLLPHQREVAANRLVELIEDAGNHLGTGFLSTAMLLPTLVETGHAGVAYRLLLQDTAPSWLHQVAHGATTIWENWEGYRPNGRAKGSHNHFAFGGVAQFLQENVGGIAPLEPGYRRFSVSPAVTSGLRSAGTTIRTPYGDAACSWGLIDSGVRIEVTVPGGTTAELVVGEHRQTLAAGAHLVVMPVD